MAWGGRRTGKRRGNVYRCVIKKQAIAVNRQRDLQTVTSLRVVSPGLGWQLKYGVKVAGK